MWASGIRTWQDFARAGHFAFGGRRAERIKTEIAASEAALESRRAAYFSRLLPADQQWRLFGDFRNRVAYVDIETTGLGADSSRITTIALYDGMAIRYYVYGKNLDRFPDDIRRYDLLVTYNGRSFDLPFIERYFGIRLHQGHIDLRYVLAGLGYKGGLKNCERRFGISRDGFDDVDGSFAALLWHDYERRGNPYALETLLAYNIEDAINLEYLMHQAYNLKLSQTPFASEMALAMPVRPKVPFAPVSGVLRRLRRKLAAAQARG